MKNINFTYFLLKHIIIETYNYVIFFENLLKHIIMYILSH
jgi:hypothetical protein